MRDCPPAICRGRVSQVPVRSITNRDIPGPDGNRLPIRIYKPDCIEDPETHKKLPVLVYYHGGGFALGNLDTHDELCRMLCKKSRHIVVSVDYRQAVH